MTPTLTNGTFFLNGEPLAQTFHEISSYSFNDVALPDLPPYIKSINHPLSASAEFELETEIDIPTFRQLMGIDPAYGPDMSAMTVVFKEPYQKQVRTHKKKRINKKWAKRYGFVTAFRTWRVEEAYLNQDYKGPGFELSCRQIHVMNRR